MRKPFIRYSTRLISPPMNFAPPRTILLKGYMVYDAEKLADKCGMEYGSFRRKVKKMTR